MAKIFTVTAPDGKELEVEGPDDGTAEQALQVAQQKYQAGPSVWETIKSLPERAVLGTVSGITTSKAAFADRSAVFDPDQVETFNMYPESPAAKEYFARKAEADQTARDAKLMRGELRQAQPLGAQNSVFDEVVGGAVESAGSSIIPTIALGAINPGLGMAAGLTSNAVLEAGGQWEEAKAAGATDDQISRSMGFGGAVSTMLELPVLGSVKKLMEGGVKSVKKEILKTAGKEWGQEQLTQHAMDIEANASGWGDYSAGDIISRGLKAGASGAILGGTMGGAAHVLGMERQKNVEILQAQAVADVLAESAGLTSAEEKEALLGQVIANFQAQQLDPEKANIMRAAYAGHFANVPMTPFGQQLGALLDVASWSKVGQPADDVQDLGGISESVEERRNRYLEAGFQDTAPHAERIIVAQDNDAARGLKLGQIDSLPDGSVTVVSGSATSEQALFPLALADAMQKTGRTLMDLFGINEPLLITMEQLGGQEMGRYTRQMLPDGRQLHIINPRELPSWKYGGNQTTLAEFTYAFAHEFGHLLKMHRFAKGIEEKATSLGIDAAQHKLLMTQLNQEIEARRLTPETLLALREIAPTEADLLANWMAVVARVKTEKLTGKEFADLWFGPRKFAWGMAKTTNAQDRWDWLRAVEKKQALEDGRQARNVETLTATEIIDLLGGEQYFLNFDEFMGEQFSRAAYDRKYMEGTALGQWFQNALTKLREFFGLMKEQGFVKPQATFETWLDEQTARGKQLAKKQPKKWGQVQLSAAMKKAQKAQLAEREQERMDLAVEGELEVELPEMTVEDETAIASDPQADVLNKTLEIFEFGFSPEQLQPIRDLIKLGKFVQARRAIDELTGEKTHWDKVYVTQAIKELPNKEMLKRETVKAVLSQQKMKKNDRDALARLMEKYPEGLIPREAVEEEILAANVPLTLVKSNQYADYGLHEIGLPSNVYLQDNGSSPTNFTHIWQAPFEIPAQDNHFGDPKYVAHTRVVVGPNRVSIVELQSDLMQKQSKKDLERKAKHARDVLIYNMKMLEDADEQVAKVEAEDAHMGVTRDRTESTWHLRRDKFALRVKEAEVAFQMYSARANGLKPAEEQQVATAMNNQDWWKRIIREEFATAAEMGKGVLEIASADTIAKIEGWPTVLVPGRHKLELDIPYLIMDRALPGVTFEYETRESDLDDDLVHVMLEGQQLRSYPVDDFLGSVVYKPGSGQGRAWLNAYNALPRTFEDKGHQSIYERYRDEIIPWLQKEYGATLDDLGEGIAWWQMSVPANAREITAWDKGNPASPTYPQLRNAMLAGMDEVNATPEEIREAMDQWAKYGTDAPRFKKWWGNGVLVDGVTGDPIKLYHGSGLIIPFFDPTLSQFEEAFFFADNTRNAMTYMMGGDSFRRSSTGIMRNFSDKRKAQELRAKIATLKRAIYDERIPVKLTKDQMWDKIKEYRNALDELVVSVDYDSPTPTLGTYYVRMENPYEIDFEGKEWVRGAYDEFINTARELGHDGLIIRNVRDPLEGTIYLVFKPEQIKDAENQTGWFGPTDLTMWDKTNPTQSMLANTASTVEKIATLPGFSHMINAWHRTSDALVQLQQRAYQPLPDGSQDAPMIAMLNSASRAEAFKNSLQFHGEQLVKAMWQRSPKELDKVYAVLEAEWLSGELAFDLIGYDNLPTLGGEIIWGKLPDGGMDVTAATGKRVKYWGLAPTAKFEELLTKQGISLDTPQGRELSQMIVDTKLAMMEQFTALERVLQQKIVDRWGGAPMVAAQELEQLYQTMQKIRSTPFFPQGRYGNWVISIQEKKENPKFGERKYKLVRVEHYQSKSAMQKALRKWHEQANRTPGKFKISMKPLDELRGIPLQLPANLLDQLAKADIFTAEELEVLQAFMVPVGHEKIEQRFASWNEKLLGGDRDIVRNFSNFIWHNANYIWKLKYRAEFGKAITAQRKLYNDAQKAYSPAGRAQADKLLRNMQIMSRVKEAVLHPAYEFQGLRQAVALVYLAYNVKTALMNVSTMINSYAAITTEYGELAGHKFYAKGLFDTARLYSMLRDKKSGQLSAQDSELVWVYGRAVREGLIDQSFAFFLAGQANMATDFKGFRKGYFAKLSYGAQHAGMFPFRMMEKANRIGTLMMFFGAERARGTGIEEAYQAAAMRTDLLQNAYNQANRSELFRGKKALFTMFMSYIQFMTWNVYGGYAKAVRTDLKSRGLEVQHLGGAQAYSVKLLLLYMLLGGMMAGPGFEDLMEVINWVWRKLFKTDAREELRDFVQGLGADPDLVMHGVLSNVAGMDLSGSFSLGRMVPGVQLLNKSFDNAAEFFGAMATKMSGPFGGFTEDLVNTATKFDAVLRGGARGAELAKEMPGAIGAVGRAWDAYTLQSLNPGQGMGVLDKKGARVVEDPPRSGNFRDLTNWELIGTALGGNPAVLSRSRELRYHELGEQIYWRTKQTQLLDARWKAIRTNNESALTEAMSQIDKFNDNLPETHSTLRITGKMMAESLRTHRKTVQRDEAGRVQKRFQGVIDQMRD